IRDYQQHRRHAASLHRLQMSYTLPLAGADRHPYLNRVLQHLDGRSPVALWNHDAHASPPTRSPRLSSYSALFASTWSGKTNAAKRMSSRARSRELTPAAARNSLEVDLGNVRLLNQASLAVPDTDRAREVLRGHTQPDIASY